LENNVITRGTESDDVSHIRVLLERAQDNTKSQNLSPGDAIIIHNHSPMVDYPLRNEVFPALRHSPRHQDTPKARISATHNPVTTVFQRHVNKLAKLKKTEKSKRTLNIVSEHLVDLLTRAKVESVVPYPRKFIPEGQLELLVTQLSVKQELQRSLFKACPLRKPSLDAHWIQNLSRKICPEASEATPRVYRKIFAILLLIGKVHKIESFVKAEVSDEDLPLVQLEGSSRLTRETEADVLLTCFDDWKRCTNDRFEEVQWTVLAPTFRISDDNSVTDYILDSKEIIPFTSWKEVAKGKSGIVYQAKIHPDHQRLMSQEV
jgi:hypothetical protein